MSQVEIWKCRVCWVAVPEVMHTGGLMLASQAALISLSIAGDVEGVLSFQLLQLCLDGIPASACIARHKPF